MTDPPARRRFALPASAALFFALAVAASASAQVRGRCLPDTPEATTVAALARLPGTFHDCRVIVQGEVGFSFLSDPRVGVLEDPDEIGREVLMVEPAFGGSGTRLQFIGADKVEVEGWFYDTSRLESFDLQRHPLREYAVDLSWFRDSLDERTRGLLAIVSIDPIEDTESAADAREAEAEAAMAAGDAVTIAPGSAVALTIESLLGDPDPWLGRRVEIVGKFRGNNLFGDLSIQDKKTPRDFILKTATSSIWVTGMNPAGRGFRLDPRRRRDTGKWLRVFGRPWTESGMTYLRAERIELADDPGDPALEPVDLKAEEAAEAAARVDPLRVVFSLPLDGEREIGLESEFRVQFSNRMAPASFDASVDLLYSDTADDENPFPDLEVTYDAPTRTLLVLPRRPLEPDREIHLVLYDEIEDEHGQRLAPTEEAAEWGEGAAVVLSFRTAPS